MDTIYAKELKTYFGVVILTFLASAWLGYFITASSPQELEYVQREFSDLQALLSDFTSFSFFLLIFLNNAIKIFLAVVLGIGFGIFPVMFVFANGYFIGSAAFVAKEVMGWPVFFLAIAPHGIMELPAFFLAGAIGYMLGAKMLRNVFRGREYQIKKEVALGLRWFFRVILPLVFIAAFVEVFITPLFISFVL